MTKKLAFGGKGLDIVGGSRVQEKKGSRTGIVQSIRFRGTVPTKYQIKWDGGLTSWVDAKLLKEEGK